MPEGLFEEVQSTIAEIETNEYVSPEQLSMQRAPIWAACVYLETEETNKSLLQNLIEDFVGEPYFIENEVEILEHLEAIKTYWAEAKSQRGEKPRLIIVFNGNQNIYSYSEIARRHSSSIQTLVSKYVEDIEIGVFRGLENHPQFAKQVIMHYFQQYLGMYVANPQTRKSIVKKRQWSEQSATQQDNVIRTLTSGRESRGMWNYSQDEILFFISMYEARDDDGQFLYTYEQILEQGKEIFRDERTVNSLHHLRKTLELPPRVQTAPWTNEEDEILRSLRHQSHTIQEIAHELGRTIYSIQNRLKSLELTNNTNLPAFNEDQQREFKWALSNLTGWNAVVNYMNEVTGENFTLASLKGRASRIGIHLQKTHLEALTDIEINQLKDLAEQNLTYQEIADEMNKISSRNWTPGNVRYHLDSHSIIKISSQKSWEEVKSDFLEGLELAELLKWSKETLVKWLESVTAYSWTQEDVHYYIHAYKNAENFKPPRFKKNKSLVEKLDIMLYIYSLSSSDDVITKLRENYGLSSTTSYIKRSEYNKLKPIVDSMRKWDMHPQDAWYLALTQFEA